MKALFFLGLLLSSAVFAFADDTTVTDNSPPPPNDSTKIPVDPNTLIKVVVEGVVLCQDCSNRGSWSLFNSKPIKDAKVTITCRDFKNRPAIIQAVQTDANGYFYCPFDVVSMKDYFKQNPLSACFVRLLSSPDQGCNALTNINWGIVGSPVKFDGKLFKGGDYVTAVLNAGPLAFRPSWCPLSG